MDGILSFLRFLIPGATLTIWCFFAGMILENRTLEDALGTFEKGSALISIVFIAAAGYLLSQIYRHFYPIHGLDHIHLVNKLIERGLITVTSHQGDRLLKQITGFGKEHKEDAYQILTVIWHQHTKHFDMNKGDFQAHILNSNGAVLMATRLMAWGILPISLIFYADEITGERWFLVLAFWVILVLFCFMLNRAFDRTVRMYTSWIESAIMSMILLLKNEENTRYRNFVIRIEHFKFVSNSGLDFRP